MRIIFSRKGFDSTAGGVASPIFPSGEMYSLPIPVSGSNEPFHQYDDIKTGGRDWGPIVSDLTDNKVTGAHHLHLDPDLYKESVPRPPRWRPIFGQAGSAETHLQNQRVSEGDLFLFYGWFNGLTSDSRPYRYDDKGAGVHVIFGWLQVDLHVSVRNGEDIPNWAKYHQHCRRTPQDRNDFIYISKERLNLDDFQIDKPGAGTFRRFHEALRLTYPGETRSVWRLPSWILPAKGRSPLTYHRTPSRWTEANNFTRLQSAGRGQEFVLNCDEYPEAIEWLAGILSLAP